MRLARQAFATLLTALFVLCAASPQAHEFKLDALVSTFVKVDANEAHLIVRAPLYLFKSVRFPVKGTEIDSDNSAAALERALALLRQNVVLLADDQPLTPRSAVGRLTLPSDRSFETYEEARDHTAKSLEPGTAIAIDQGYVDAHFIYPIESNDAVFSLRTTIAPEFGEALKVTVRYSSAAGESNPMVLRGGMGTVDLNPTWFGAARGFVAFGIAHILTGIDHLLFLLCLVVPLRGVRQLLTVITGFTLAHSCTLIGSAFGLAPSGAWFAPFVEFVIALSIVFVALENLVGVDLRRRVLLTILFGLVHGFGFSYGLKEDLQFAGSHLLVSLFAFNVGIELGQLIVLAVMLPALALAQRYLLAGRMGMIILGALVAHTGWHWMTERWDALMAARWPSIGLASVPALLGWGAALALVIGAVIALVPWLRLDGGRERRAPASDAVNLPAAE